MSSTKIIGIVNLTPDSFSDGGEIISDSDAISRARELIQEGADYIEIGGDSTRPGSVCVGAEEEWRRISGVVAALSDISAISVDTHHPEVAESALSAGASMINDISGGDPRILAAVARHKRKIVLMYAASRPHDFSHLEQRRSAPLLQTILEKLKGIGAQALKAGIEREDIILDPGMGAFLTADPNEAWDVVHHFEQFETIGFPLCFAASRKGFLRLSVADSPVNRDGLSALGGILTVLRHKNHYPLYLRVHNVKLQRSWLHKAMSR